MSLLKNFIVILTVWAYALQAVAGVASPCQHAAGSHASVHFAASAELERRHDLLQAALAEDGEHLAGFVRSHESGQAASACAQCAQCDHGGCSCSDRSCSSAPGITSTATLGSDTGPGVAPRVLSPLDPRQAFQSGLIRPPSIS